MSASDPAEGLFEVSYGLPRPRWGLIRKWVFAATDPAARHARWCAAQRLWLDRLAAAHRPVAYQSAESEHFLVWTAARGDVGWITDFAEQARGQVAELVGEPYKDDEGGTVGKVVVLIFGGEADYRRYVRHYSPDGRPGPSAGVWIHDGDAHVAICGLAGFKATLAHELVHAHLARPHRRPLWFEEGLAQHLERVLVVRQRLPAGPSERQDQRLFWRSRTLDEFWSGAAFHDDRADGPRDEAYRLAELIVREMAALGPTDLRRFAALAEREDAGHAASHHVYGFGLEVWAANVLGKGDWRPRLIQQRPADGDGGV